jgi:hypothetical protein
MTDYYTNPNERLLISNLYIEKITNFFISQAIKTQSPEMIHLPGYIQALDHIWQEIRPSTPNQIEQRKKIKKAMNLARKIIFYNVKTERGFELALQRLPKIIQDIPTKYYKKNPLNASIQKERDILLFLTRLTSKTATDTLSNACYNNAIGLACFINDLWGHQPMLGTLHLSEKIAYLISSIEDLFKARSEIPNGIVDDETSKKEERLRHWVYRDFYAINNSAGMVQRFIKEVKEKGIKPKTAKETTASLKKGHLTVHTHYVLEKNYKWKAKPDPIAI